MEQELFIKKGMAVWLKKWQQYIAIDPVRIKQREKQQVNLKLNNNRVVNILTSMVLTLI